MLTTWISLSSWSLLKSQRHLFTNQLLGCTEPVETYLGLTNSLVEQHELYWVEQNETPGLNGMKHIEIALQMLRLFVRVPKIWFISFRFIRTILENKNENG